MWKSEHNHGGGDRSDSGLPIPPADELDREIDAALSRYAAVVPRTGLEERVLANLDAERGRVGFNSWRWWPFVGVTVAAVVLVAVVSFSALPRKGKSVAHNPFNVTQDAHQSEIPVATNGGRAYQRSAHSVLMKKHAERTRVARIAVLAEPRLEQFPSPLPLSEQEQILTHYVSQFRNQAVLVARARTEELRRDLAEELANSTEDSEPDKKD